MTKSAVDSRQLRLRYQSQGKAEFFSSLILDELALRPTGLATVLDIGCGGGFHDRPDLQQLIGTKASRFIGVEPDKTAAFIDSFDIIYPSSLEDAPIEPNSVDVAYAVMVLEHVTDPKHFFAKVEQVLAPGGVFFGFTVDANHWFRKASVGMENLGVKEAYLDLIRGKRGENTRYENFPTAYLCNTDKQLKHLLEPRFKVSTLSLHKIGQLDYYFPSFLRPFSRLVDRATMAVTTSGSTLVVHAKKAY